MTTSSARGRRFKTVASIAIGLTSFIVAACSSENGLTSGSNVVPNRAAHFDTSPTPTPYKYEYNTVDDEGGSTTFNRVLGMNDLSQVVGYYSGYSVTRGFTSTPPYTKFKVISYPNSQSSVATSITNNRIIGGYFLDTGHGESTLGFLRDRGLWSIIKDIHTPKELNSVNEVLGVNSNVIAVGYYVDAYGIDQAFAEASRHFTALRPPGSLSTRATGINSRGDMVGSAVLSNGQTVGWVYRSGVYTEFSAPNSNDTEPTSANIQGQIAGSYVDGSGATHGFVVRSPGNPTEAFWQTIDEPNAVGTTVVTTINNHHAISGWYVDAYGNNNGFVGTITSP